MNIVIGKTEAAFNRVDLCVVIAITCAFMFLTVRLHSHAKSVGKEARCCSNLKLIGQATAMYGNQNSDKLPYAFVMENDRRQLSWDTLLSSFLYNEGANDSELDHLPMNERMGRLLNCPQDEIPGITWGGKVARRRTYSIPWHNMYPENWPPAGNNRTGIGLWWAPFGGTNSNISSIKQLASLPALTRSIISDPAMLIQHTEMARSNNIIANSSGAIVKTTVAQLDTNQIALNNYHQGKFNYLFTDGHVDALVPRQTVGHTGLATERPETHRGMWTLDPED